MEHNYNKGSEWRKWDLHIHTKGTNKNDQFSSASFEIFCITLFRKALEKKIAVIGITDYFSIARYKEILHYKNNIISTDSNFNDSEKKQINAILLLPNIELRMLPVTDSGRLVNIHCIFNPDYERYLEHDFFSKIEHSGASGNYAMNKSGITRLGEELFPSATTDQERYKYGLNNFVVEHGRLKKIFEENKALRENTVIIVSNSNKDGASAMQKHYDFFEASASSLEGVRKSIYNLSDCIFSSNKNDRDYFSGIKKNRAGEVIDDVDSIIKKCGSLKPCVHGSDAHSEDKLFAPDEDKYCWIKADTTFEGLKQILCEPLDRIRIQLNHPDEKKSYNVIDSVKFVNKSGDKRFLEDAIAFSSGLNAIIGGKSSGKSLLLHMMASEIGNSIDLKDYQQAIGDAAIEVYYKDDPFEKRTKDDNRSIEFLPQLYIEKLVRNEAFKNTTIRSLNEFVENLIKQDSQIKDIIINSDNRISSAVSNIDASITLWNNLDSQLQLSKGELSQLGDKIAIENEIEIIKNRIEKLTAFAGWSEEQKSLYQILIEDNKNNEKTISSLKTGIDELNRLKIYIQDNLINKIENLISFTSTDVAVFNLIKILKESLGTSLSEVLERFDLIMQPIIRERQEKIDILSEKIRNNNNELEPLIQKNTILIEINKHQESLKFECNKIANIIEKESQVERIRTNIKAIDFVAYYKIIIDSYYDLTTNLNELISTKWTLEVTKLDIRARAEFNSSVFIDSIGSAINMKGYLNNQFGNDIFNINEYEYNKEDHLNKLNRLVEYGIKENDRFTNFKQGRTTKEFLSAILKDCFSIEYDIIKGTDSLQSMSEGKKGIVILQLYLSLSQSDCPILIDQPEDNLDNRTVYQELNDYIKQCKLRRQIIMVSHNANLVVNTDAENIIVANQSGENGNDNKNFRFEYVNGALEKTFSNNMALGVLYKQGIREHVCEILEGGVDAFKKREEKYHIK